MDIDKKLVAKSFGTVIKTTRAKRKISQEQLALEINIARSFLSELERGVKQPTLSTIIAISEALGHKASSLVSQVEKIINT